MKTLTNIQVTAFPTDRFVCMKVYPYELYVMSCKVLELMETIPLCQNSFLSFFSVHCCIFLHAVGASCALLSVFSTHKKVFAVVGINALPVIIDGGGKKCCTAEGEQETQTAEGHMPETHQSTSRQCYGGETNVFPCIPQWLGNSLLHSVQS